MINSCSRTTCTIKLRLLRLEFAYCALQNKIVEFFLFFVEIFQIILSLADAILVYFKTFTTIFPDDIQLALQYNLHNF